ncbi:UNVERIFIED_CONTAM: hypothetical protein PYX00_006015 [Menopon gallinae]|uniref:AN1-type domain-containing protein n=1 Tax=Menopon gallinae TaxID=328185 RepID=A0AAW2HTJ1_9NEOP
MELPHLGEQCSEPTCKKLDFLPVKCDACGNIYCMDHMSYVQHSCPSAHKKDVQVPICPLCGSPVPTPRNQPPDIAVSEHIDRDCQSDPAKAKRKVKANKCALPGCRVKELVPVICSECRQNFCLRHRFPDDHKCVGKKGKVLEASIHRQEISTYSHVLSVQGNMSEDEALAKAISESMKETTRSRGQSTVPTSVNRQRCRVS